MENDYPDIKNFESVWERVQQKPEEENEPQSESQPVADFKPRPRAVRFLPKF